LSQRIEGLYRLVTVPALYKGLQTLLGAAGVRDIFIRDVAGISAGMRVLDVGCGPGSYLPHLPQVDYTGIDLNPKHIAHARAKHGTRGRFIVGDAVEALAGEAGQFDVIMVSALLHHLDDAHAMELLAGLSRLCREGGRIATLDNVWLPDQNPVARWLNSRDSGLNIRTPEAYTRIAQEAGLSVTSRVYRGLLVVPYDYFCMTLTRGTSP
jgi:SAM-dependent methyltransferase